MSRTRNQSQSTKATERKKVEQMSEQEVKSEFQMLRESKISREETAKHLIEQIASLQQTASKRIQAIITTSNIKTAEEIETYEKLKKRQAELSRRQMEDEARFIRAQEQKNARNVAAELLNRHGIHQKEYIFQAEADRNYDPSQYSHRRKKETRSLTSRKH